MYSVAFLMGSQIWDSKSGRQEMMLEGHTNSVMALQFSKLADVPEKTEEDVEDEALMESYVSSHPSEIMVIEKEELYGVIKETLEEYKGNLERFISAYGPKYVEILSTRSILPLLEQS